MRRRALVMFSSIALASLAAIGASGVSGAAPAKPSAPPQRYIVVLRDDSGSPDQVAQRQSRAYGATVEHVYRHALKGYSATVPADRVGALRSDPSVADVVDDETFVATATSCPICSVSQITTRGARRIGADQSSAHSGDGQGAVNVNIAILDSGIQPDQPDLNVVGGVDCGSGRGWADVAGHGTIVAGVAAARDNTIGIVGVAPGAPLWSVRVLDKGLSGSTSAILCGIDWVTATRTDTDPTNDIQVANMSLGAIYHGGGHDDEGCGVKPRDVIHQAICRSIAAGVTYVVSAGNDAAASVAVDRAHTLAAPGVCISSTYIGSDVAVDDGTSFAAPFGTGTVALCIASGACAGLSPTQIVAKMFADAATYNAANPGYGFQGDPQHPIAGKYYGNLIHAGSY